ncbi:DUF1810 domain-containing protein [Aureimonas sp. AU20]|uniref:DUF1810 domain-containing protein n=1 Tax=Aureimonas sp. AU20 TaxID=1349819 RepID=UPI000720C77A|nr:DUF1810 domain-containing protein [Aureimonas sp. AU20]ALN72109.1 hypothetical protein M673_05240 [Aureimonas sp. AU20]
MTSDPFDLRRFVVAQEGVYADALAELNRGRKASHWMWFVFPQIEGLGRSETARRFALRSLDEAKAYLAHPLLGPRLRKAVTAACESGERSVHTLFGSPDDMKFHSSLTLFREAAQGDDRRLFDEALALFFGGEADGATLARLPSSAR